MRQLLTKLADQLKGLARELVPSRSREALAAARQAERDARRRRQVELVKSRPTTLEQRYQLLDHAELADEIFSRLKRKVAESVDARQGPASQAAFGMLEAGRLAPGRPYFFLKPLSRKGWLFERSGAGWVVSRAEKIVAQDLFLRDGDPIDTIQLYLASDQRGYPRIRSQSMGGDLLSIAVYEQRVLQQVGLGNAS